MNEYYREVVEGNIKWFTEEERDLENTRKSVLKQLGIKIPEDLERAALIFSWLLRLYANRIGEYNVIREWRRL